jgi:hypothetical protein
MALFLHDEASGKLFYRAARKQSPAGSEAGSLHRTGYRSVSVDRCQYLVHRIIWFMVKGSWPLNQIDHINGNKADNRIENLREATNAQNTLNVPARQASSSGVKNVYYQARNKKWRVRMKVEGKSKSFGLYRTKTEAEKAAVSARNQFHGQFAKH